MTVLLDAAGRRRSPATLPGYHAGRPPRNKGIRYPADPPTVDEIVAVMRHTSDDRHGWRVRAMRFAAGHPPPAAGGDLEVGGVQLLAPEDSLGDPVVDPLAAGGGAPWLRTAAPNGSTGSLNVEMTSDSEKKPTTLTVSVPTLTTPCGTIAGMTAMSPAVRCPR